MSFCLSVYQSVYHLNVPNYISRQYTCSFDQYSIIKYIFNGTLKGHNIIRTLVLFFRKQMEEMRKFHKCESLLEFAEVVLSLSLKDRMKLLSTYYGSKDPGLTRDLEPEVFSTGKDLNSGLSRQSKSQASGGKGAGLQGNFSYFLSLR